MINNFKNNGTAKAIYEDLITKSKEEIIDICSSQMYMIYKKDKEIERLKKCKNEVLEYLNISNMSFIDKNEIAIRLKGSDKE